MNTLSLIRDPKQISSTATLGTLSLNGKFLCDTLEDEYRDIKVHGETRIPAGTYKIELVNSPKFTPRYGHKMLAVTNVPNFQGILIHPGNTDKDTSGCILVGKRDKLTATLFDSRNTFESVYKILSPLVEAGLFINIVDADRKGK
ncbi:MAG TPA: DUF5675 family protein [Chitinophagales bacterium]|nr:DUF5675 family protein [Chitinophagales bacterium]HMW93507.1 DUF5675 family protein [Chitinophagales bacterium]HMZ92995.1 DUF5675 family protein [Chitinophagales bacterium]HNG25942.1 DUF5675 family protein [Chitinophagales bacterium]